MIKQPRFIRLIDLAIFQAIWWVAALWGNAALGWLVLLLGLHLVLVNSYWQRDLLAMLVFAPLGWGFDLSLQAWGFWNLHSTLPFWLWVIWAGFIMSLFYSLAGLKELPVITQSLIGGTAGMFSYLAGAKLGAISFVYPLFNSILILFFIWSLFLPVLIASLYLFKNLIITKNS